MPAAISNSISSAMKPLLQQVGQVGADGMDAMVKGLSSRFSEDVGRALASASESLEQAGDRLAQLSERMNQSSGRVGAEIDSAVTRLTQAIDDLGGAMGATAQTASGAFTQGAEHMLAVMSQTLEKICDNTRENASALSAAAAEMREAARGFRSEIGAATAEGTMAARELSGSRQRKYGRSHRFGRNRPCSMRWLVPQRSSLTVPSSSPTKPVGNS